jgi:hypothetical protein
VSRETYRILQNSLTNVLRHVGKVPVTLRVTVGDQRLELAVTNPVSITRWPATGTGNGPSGGGHGLRGMAERLKVLRGVLSAGRNGDQWEVMVKLPVVGQAGDGAEGPGLVARSRPDVVLADGRAHAVGGRNRVHRAFDVYNGLDAEDHRDDHVRKRRLRLRCFASRRLGCGQRE